MSGLYCIPVRALPYPHAVGKSDYENLESRLDELIGDEIQEYHNPNVSAHEFYTNPRYQEIVREELASMSGIGDIVQYVNTIFDRVATVWSMKDKNGAVFIPSDDWENKMGYVIKKDVSEVPERFTYSEAVRDYFGAWLRTMNIEVTEEEETYIKNFFNDPITVDYDLTTIKRGSGRHRLTALRTFAPNVSKVVVKKRTHKPAFGG